jgi:hypothetical protein
VSEHKVAKRVTALGSPLKEQIEMGVKRPSEKR